MFLDDDDEFLNNKIGAQVECLDNLDSEWGACYTSYVRKRGGVIFEYSMENREGDLLVEQLKRNLFVQAGSNLMVRRHVVEELGGFDESFTRNQDLEFMVRLLCKYKLAYVNEMGLAVNLHSGQVRSNSLFITQQFIDTFDSVISTLPVEQQRDILETLALQDFRHKLLHLKAPIDAYSMVVKKDISFVRMIKYILYLAKRKITKTCCPFLG